jgi:glycosyltransferase involved in cell wall biosynthesis
MTGSTPGKVPLVSVILPVYNSEKYVADAIDSILRQSFTDFELIIIDDGSNDQSAKIIRGFVDSRIVFVSRPNKKLVATLNEGIGLANGRYIARQDADDVSLPTRLARQVEFLEAYADIGMLGTNYFVVDEAGRTIGRTNVFTHPQDLRVAETLENQFGHGSVMFRKSILEVTGLYDASVRHAEDSDLWNRFAKVTSIANLKEPLYKWQANPEGISARNATEQSAQMEELSDKYFAAVLENPDRFDLYRSWHPFSVRGGPCVYFDKKALCLHRSALRFASGGLLGQARKALWIARLLAPWRRRLWRSETQ